MLIGKMNLHRIKFASEKIVADIRTEFVILKASLLIKNFILPLVNDVDSYSSGMFRDGERRGVDRLSPHILI